MNAKERRKLKREAERTAEPAAPVSEPASSSHAVKEGNAPSPAKAAAPSSAAGSEAVNAKASRMLKRAQEKSAETGGGASSSAGKAGSAPPSAKPQSASVDPASMEGLNAKERRMLKRAREREEQASAPAPVASGAGSGSGSGSGNGKKGVKRQRVEEPVAKHVPYVLFVGQLSYKTEAEMLRKHLQAGGVEGQIKVRLMTDKATKKSKGQAFVEVQDAATLHKCLTLHHTRLDGRVINVEKSCGGKSADKRKERLTALRSEQASVLRESRDRILKEKIEGGQLQEGELDEQAMALLERYDGETVSAILDTYCAEERSKLRNPSAFFMCYAKKVIEGEVKPPSKEEKDKDKGGNKPRPPRPAQGADKPSHKPQRDSGSGKARPANREGVIKREEEEEEEAVVKMEVQEEEERGWTIGHSMSESRALSGVKPKPRRDEEDYDLGRVFASVRGRGGGRMGGRGRGRGRG